MAFDMDEVRRQIDEAGEGAKLPDELLELVSGGGGLATTLTWATGGHVKDAAIFHKHFVRRSLEEAMAYERDERIATEDDLKVPRDIWDLI